VALLLDVEGSRSAEASASASPQPRRLKPALYDSVEVVVKIGGGLLKTAKLDAVLDAIGDLARDARVLIVPGGGPFADAVRDVDRRVHLSDDAAHWMAVLAMDQYAHLIASRLPRGCVVERPDAIAAALGKGTLPVIAPSSWLREVDPLPHSWDVTSD